MFFPIAKRRSLLAQRYDFLTRYTYRPATTFISNEEFASKTEKRRGYLPITEVAAATAGSLVAKLWLSKQDQDAPPKYQPRVPSPTAPTSTTSPVSYPSIKIDSIDVPSTIRSEPTLQNYSVHSNPATCPTDISLEDQLLHRFQSIVSKHDGQHDFMLALSLSKLPYDSKRQETICGLFEQAAYVGHVEAALNAGICYDPRSSYEHLKDTNRAIVLYKLAAIEGHKRAQFRLGMLLLHECTEEDALEEAFKWIRLSAAQNYEPAQQVLNSIQQLAILK
jgi:hypothetical protein